jgi:hypothetical protein
MGLFSEQDTPCAYYLFTKDGLGEEWEEQALEEATGNSSLVIE